MKTPFQFRLANGILAVCCCFLFLNSECEVAKDEVPEPDKEITSNPRSGINQFPIDVLILWSADQAYQECIQNNGRCDQEKLALAEAEKYARIVFPFPPLPTPPNPCTPWGICDGLEMLENVVTSINDPIKITVIDEVSKKVVAFTQPDKMIPSGYFKDYGTAAVVYEDKGFSGNAVVIMESLTTKQVVTLTMSMQ